MREQRSGSSIGGEAERDVRYIQPNHRKKWTKEQREQVFQKTRGRCAYCGTEITVHTMQIDHVIPIEFYDVYEVNFDKDLNDMDNLLPACRSCNNYKHSLTLDKFRAALERMPDVLARDNVTYRIATRYGLVVPNPMPVKFYFETLKEKDGDIIAEQ